MKDEDSIKAGVQQVVQKLFDRDGSVKASALVEEARPKTSPAHGGFTWDDKKAAHQFRLVEARNWIRVIVVKPDESKQPERMVHVPVVISDAKEAESKEGEYKPISVVQADPDEYVRARAAALNAVKAAARALNELDTIAAHAGKSDITALISQLSRGLDMFEKAIATMH